MGMKEFLPESDFVYGLHTVLWPLLEAGHIKFPPPPPSIIFNAILSDVLNDLAYFCKNLIHFFLSLGFGGSSTPH